MARIITSVPNLHIRLSAKEVRLIKPIRSVSLQAGKLTVEAVDGLTAEEYGKLALWIRVIFSFSFEAVYSENYQVNAKGAGFHFTGHDQRKAHLLGLEYRPSRPVLESSAQIFRQTLRTDTKQGTDELFEELYLWVRAQELAQLHLILEARTHLWRLVELILKDSSESKAQRLLVKQKARETPASIFAAMLMTVNDREMPANFATETEALSRLYKLLGLSTQQTLLKKTRAAETAFIFETCRVLLLWRLGQHEYTLKKLKNIVRQ